MSDNRKKMWVMMLLVLQILAVYWNSQYFAFLDYDDQSYVTANWHIRSGLTWESVKWAFTSTELGFWHPLTWLSLLLDSRWSGLNPAGYHWTNVLFHMANTLLLFLALHQMTGTLWRSGFVAALFAIHPLHVESVAWIAERKDVLSAFFWMLTMGAYIYYVERPGLCRYLWVLLFFILGLMAKPMLVTLPFVLLLLDYWPLSRFQAGQSHTYQSSPDEHLDMHRRHAGIPWLIIEKVPLLMLSVAASFLVYVTEQHFGALASLESFPLESRFSNTLISYTAYLGKTFIPLDLAAFYPYPGNWPLWQVMLSGFILLAVSFFVLHYAKRFPYLAVGWLWYLGVLMPVIGIIQIGSTAMADRFTYLPLIGIFLIIVYGSSDFMKNRKNWFLILMCAVIVMMSLLSWIQIQYWQNNTTLFYRAIQVTKNNYKALHVLGITYHRQGDDNKAIDCLTESIRLKPDESRVHNDLGVVYMGQRRFRDAQRQFTAALKLRPDNVNAINNMGAALASQGMHKEAVQYFREALRIDPNDKSAMENLEKITQWSRRHR